MTSVRNYWSNLFTGTTWQGFLDAGGNVSRHPESRWKALQRLQQGDYLLCYLTGIARWVGVLEVVSAPYRDSARDERFPCCVKAKIIVALTPETAIPIREMKDKLTIFCDLKSPTAWTGRLRTSIVRWEPSDGEMILNALLESRDKPALHINPL